VPSSEQILSPALLIAETNPRILGSLTEVVNERMPDVRFDVCSTRLQIARNVQSFSYDTVISNLRLADSVFLKRNQEARDVLPLVITADAADTESAGRSLGRGAFDVITYPLHPDQAVATIRLALWYRQILRLLRCNERVVQKCAECLDGHSDEQRMTAGLRSDLDVIQGTLRAIEQTLAVVKKAGLPEMAARIETQTRAQALARLCALYAQRRKDHGAAPRAAKILIVDDDQNDLETWGSKLREHFGAASVIAVGTMDEALAVCDSQEIDCVVLDLDLSASSGFELLLELIPNRGRPKIAVVVLTRLVAPSLHQMALHNGAQACLVKQFTSPRALSDAIRKAIASTSTSSNDNPTGD
jgi:DNA-binding NtrC family response regulator